MKLAGFSTHLPARPTGATGIRLSLRPLTFERANGRATLGRNSRREDDFCCLKTNGSRSVIAGKAGDPVRRVPRSIIGPGGHWGLRSKRRITPSGCRLLHRAARQKLRKIRQKSQRDQGLARRRWSTKDRPQSPGASARKLRKIRRKPLRDQRLADDHSPAIPCRLPWILPWTCARACPAFPSSACAGRRSRRLPFAARCRRPRLRPCGSAA